MENDNIPPIFRLIMDEANRPRSAEEKEVARRFTLGAAIVGEYIAAKPKIAPARKN